MFDLVVLDLVFICNCLVCIFVFFCVSLDLFGFVISNLVLLCLSNQIYLLKTSHFNAASGKSSWWAGPTRLKRALTVTLKWQDKQILSTNNGIVFKHIVFSVPSQEIGWKERLRIDLFCVEWDVNLARFSSVQSMKRSSVRPSVRPLVCLSRHLTSAPGLLLSAVRTGDIHQQRQAPGARHQRRRSTALSSKCEQCHVYSRRRKLNTDLLLYIEWIDVTVSMATIRSPFCGYNMA